MISANVLARGSAYLSNTIKFTNACSVISYFGRTIYSSSVFQQVKSPFRRLSCERSYLVDPASSHMLVSKIKPCMSKYKHSYCETANGSLNQLSFI